MQATVTSSEHLPRVATDHVLIILQAYLLPFLPNSTLNHQPNIAHYMILPQIKHSNFQTKQEIAHSAVEVTFK
jgi:hypothetical protein